MQNLGTQHYCLLRVPNGERKFKLTYLPEFLEYEAKIADLGFSSKRYFFPYFVLKIFHFEKSYGAFIFYAGELRCAEKNRGKFSKN